MKPIVPLLVLGAVLASLTASVPVQACGVKSLPDEPYEEFIKEGYFRDRQGDYRGAIDIFKRAIAMRPTNRKVRYLIANTYWRDNQWTNARLAYIRSNLWSMRANTSAIAVVLLSMHTARFTLARSPPGTAVGGW